MKKDGKVYGAIDIGSNAIRLLVEYVEPYPAETEFKNAAYIRVPIRLGEDVFTAGRVRGHKSGLLIEAMQGFSHLMRAYRVDRYRACATSAMREAANGGELIARIEGMSGIRVEIISGREEAGLVYKAGRFEQFIDPDKSYVYMDVGGGSTEIIVYTNHRVVTSESFPLGTVRSISGGTDRKEFDKFTAHLTAVGQRYRPAAIIGSGGNINKVHKMLGKKSGEQVSAGELKTLYRKLSAMTFEQRMERAGLNSYRADVILPALELFYTAARCTGVAGVIVPKVGLVDGIIRDLFDASLDELTAKVPG